MSSSNGEYLVNRHLFLIILFLLFGSGVQGQNNPQIRLSTIIQSWDATNRQLDLFFNVVNSSNQTTELSCIVLIKTRHEEMWRYIQLPAMIAGSSDMYHISFLPETIKKGETFNVSVNLYGKNYKDFKDREDINLKISSTVRYPNGLLHLDFEEYLPWRPPPKEIFPPKTVKKLSKLLVFETEMNALEKKERGSASQIIKVDTQVSKKGFLQVVSNLPVDSTEDVKPESRISITFNEPIDEQSIDSETIRVVAVSGKSAGKTVSGGFKVRADTIDFSPEKKLDYSVFYRVEVSDRVTSINGRQPESPIVWTFKTEKMTIKEIMGPKEEYLIFGRMFPGVNAIDVLLDTQIKISFGSNIDSATVNNQTFALFLNGIPVDGEHKVRKNQVVFKPEKPLSYGSQYQVRVNRELKDYEGKTLKNTIQWFFKTRKGIQYPEGDDPNILIFSSSHDPISWVMETKGVLKVGLTAFDIIQHVDINGNIIDIPKDTQAGFEVPYELKARTTPFEITAFTNAGKSSKRFTINYGKKPKRPSFQLVGILGLASLDNLYSSPDTKVSDVKLVLTVVPQYELRFWEDSAIRFKGILLREKFSKSDYVDKETSYTQIAVDWVQKNTFLGDLSGGIGWNFVKTNNSSFAGENDVLAETFVGFALKRKYDKNTTWDAGFEYKNKNSYEEAADVDDETDAVEMKLKGKGKIKAFGFLHNGKFEYITNDAVGKYQDYSSYTLGYTGSYAMGDVTPSLGYTYKSKTMAISNPSEGGVTPQYTYGKILVKMKYKWSKKSFISLELENKNQVSNLEESTYTNNTITLSLTWMW